MSKKRADRDDNGNRWAGYAAFMSMRRRAMELRDADPIRKARSEAWNSAGEDASIEQRILAANAAETALRMASGITEPLNTSTPASDDEHPFPSDARSLRTFDDWKAE